MKAIILGSTSVFRKSILEKLNIPFETAKPDIDETPLANETPIALVERLAIEKAQAVAESLQQGLVIGSDQVAVCNNTILGKPHNFENALKQLTSFSGKKVTFLTGLSVIDAETGKTTSLVEPFDVYFRQITSEEITQYLHAEQPYNCAGSFKSEGLGITLFEKLAGDDPNTLIGLPLIKLVAMLKEHGVDVLQHQPTDS